MCSECDTKLVEECRCPCKKVIYVWRRKWQGKKMDFYYCANCSHVVVEVEDG